VCGLKVKMCVWTEGTECVWAEATEYFGTESKVCAE